jgi:hypothetical protein
MFGAGKSLVEGDTRNKNMFTVFHRGIICNFLTNLLQGCVKAPVTSPEIKQNIC